MYELEQKEKEELYFRISRLERELHNLRQKLKEYNNEIPQSIQEIRGSIKRSQDLSNSQENLQLDSPRNQNDKAPPQDSQKSKNHDSIRQLTEKYESLKQQKELDTKTSSPFSKINQSIKENREIIHQVGDTKESVQSTELYASLLSGTTSDNTDKLEFDLRGISFAQDSEDTKPKQETKSETKQEAKHEIKLEKKPETKSETKPETKSETKPETKS